MARLFGTDGVRGLANKDITAELALDLSVAAAHVLAEVGEFNGHRPVAVVGRDPRASGEFLAAATVAGLASAGVDVRDAGVLPTPAIAYLVAEQRADLGAMLSASHNPMADNGIKFFARGGHKLADELEDAIEQRLGEQWQRPTGADVGRITPLADGADRYVAHLLSVLPHRLDGLRVVEAPHTEAADDELPVGEEPEAHARHPVLGHLGGDERGDARHPIVGCLSPHEPPRRAGRRRPGRPVKEMASDAYSVVACRIAVASASAKRQASWRSAVCRSTGDWGARASTSSSTNDAEPQSMGTRRGPSLRSFSQNSGEVCDRRSRLGSRR